MRTLLADSGFPGMKVLQFAFGGGDNEYLPHNHTANCVVYPGTHDNTTLADWWENGATPQEKACAAAYLHLTPLQPTARQLAAVPVAQRAIVPLYDWLGLGGEAHLNTPGRLGGNWAWRAAANACTPALAAQIRAECQVYSR